MKASHPRELRRAKMLRELDLSWNQPWPQVLAALAIWQVKRPVKKMTSRYLCVIY